MSQHLVALIQGQHPDQQIGYHRTFQKMCDQQVLGRYVPLPYKPLTGIDVGVHWKKIHNEVLGALSPDHDDILLFQWYHGDLPDPRPLIARAREINPRVVVITTCGDPFGRWWQRPPISLCQAAAHSDLTFLTSMGYMADILHRHGAKNLVLMPNGVCQERFATPPYASQEIQHDLIFIGSNNGGRNPFTPLSKAGRLRRKMVDALTKRYGKRFALYGRNWAGNPSWLGPVPYPDQHRVIHSAKIQIGGFPGSYADYYTSDRFYIGLAAGVPMIDYAVARVVRLITPDTHWLPYRDLDGMIRHIDVALSWSDAQRAAMGDRAQRAVYARHTQAHRAREMLTIAQALADHRRQGLTMPPPHLGCFDTSVDPAGELPWAVRYWHG